MKLTNIVSIKGYDAGKNGNMLVGLDENLVLDTTYTNPKGTRQREIKPYICTAEISAESAKMLRSKYGVDANTYCDRIIVVNKGFMRLFNKTQLALLARQNGKENYEHAGANETDVDRQVAGDVRCLQVAGKLVGNHAMKKADKRIHKQANKAARGYHRAYKKGVDLTQHMCPEDLENMIEDMFDDINDVIDPAPATP